jgi:hypothetical protein
VNTHPTVSTLTAPISGGFLSSFRGITVTPIPVARRLRRKRLFKSPHAPYNGDQRVFEEFGGIVYSMSAVLESLFNNADDDDEVEVEDKGEGDKNKNTDRNDHNKTVI